MRVQLWTDCWMNVGQCSLELAWMLENYTDNVRLQRCARFWTLRIEVICGVREWKCSGIESTFRRREKWRWWEMNNKEPIIRIDASYCRIESSCGASFCVGSTPRCWTPLCVWRCTAVAFCPCQNGWLKMIVSYGSYSKATKQLFAMEFGSVWAITDQIYKKA